ncbi:MAG: DUF4097 family beta strand repeat protein [Eubacterium sp.]|nr:DUF4097 family beta strand repeat protein [Eubacterium sp.]
MRDITKSIISTCAGLAVIGIGMFVAGIFLGGHRGLKLDYRNRRAIVSTDEIIKEVKPLESFTEADIDIDSCDFEIIEGDEYKLEYAVNKEGVFQADVTGGKLKLDYKEKENEGAFILNVLNLGAVDEQKYIKLYVPSGTSIKKADIKLDSGDINIEGIDIADLNLKDEFGSVILIDMDSEKLVIEADSGSIRGEKIAADTVELTDKFGSIKLDDFTSKQVKMKVESGSVKVDNGKIENADIESEFGSVELSLDGTESDYSYNLSTEFGSIRVGGKNVGENETDDDDIEKYTKEGGSKKISAKTESGSIKIDFE